MPLLTVRDLTVEFGSGGEVTRPLDRFHMEAPAGTLVLLPVVALAVGLVGSLAGARRAIVVDPATAFGGP